MLAAALSLALGLACQGAGDAKPTRSEASAESLYDAAVTAATLRDTSDEELLAALGSALEAGACPTRARAEPAFAALNTDPRFRALIRDHAHQSVSVMVLPDEPGDPLVVEGTVRDARGQPIAGALVYAFQTDARGIYSPRGEAEPRLFGYARTGDDGTYGFRTIRPGHYPDMEESVEQHIHFEITPPGGAMFRGRLGFADDPFWKGRTVPGWARPVERGPDGVPHCVCDLAPW